jgi:hypothetical protein
MDRPSLRRDKAAAVSKHCTAPITISALDRNERRLAEIHTPSDDFSNKARCARMEISEEIRGVYHNIAARTHKECFKFGGCKCQCQGMPAGDPAAVAEQAKDLGSVGTGQAAGETSGEASTLESSRCVVNKHDLSAAGSGLIDNRGTAQACGKAKEGEPGTSGSSHGADVPASVAEQDGGGSESVDNQGTAQAAGGTAAEGGPGTPAVGAVAEEAKEDSEEAEAREAEKVVDPHSASNLTQQLQTVGQLTEVFLQAARAVAEVPQHTLRSKMACLTASQLSVAPLRRATKVVSADLLIGDDGGGLKRLDHAKTCHDNRPSAEFVALIGSNSNIMINSSSDASQDTSVTSLQGRRAGKSVPAPIWFQLLDPADLLFACSNGNNGSGPTKQPF